MDEGRQNEEGKSDENRAYGGLVAAERGKGEVSGGLPGAWFIVELNGPCRGDAPGVTVTLWSPLVR